jgi:hypothetical protein
MTLNILIISWLKDDSKTIMTRRVAIRRVTMPRRKRSHRIRGRRHIRRRREVRGSIGNMGETRIMKRKRRHRRYW